MNFPKPIPGLVIRYSYLWQRQHELGLEEGSKDRPCAIILATTITDGKDKVVVLPITHSKAQNLDEAIELPISVKTILGLDDAKSWVMISESNFFVWPGPDLRRIGEGENNTISYAMLPPNFFKAVRDKFVSFTRETKTKPIKRTK